MTNFRSLQVNGHLVRQRLYQLGLGERDASRIIGMTTSSIRSITSRNAMSTSFSMADARRMTDALGLTWGDLFDMKPPSAEQPDEASGDARTLVQLLSVQQKAHEPDRLARALGWDLDRLDNAVGGAQAALAALGLFIHRASSGLALRTREDLGHVQARLDVLRDDDAGIRQSTARVLYAAERGTISAQEDRNDHLVQLGRLHNLGVLVDNRDRDGCRHSPSEDFLYCLDF